MPKQDEIMDEVRRLAVITEQTRMRVVESKLALTLSLCTAAETCMSIGDPDEAAILVQQASVAAASARVSINTGAGVSLALSRKELAKLEKRIRELAARLQSKSSRPDGHTV